MSANGTGCKTKKALTANAINAFKKGAKDRTSNGLVISNFRTMLVFFSSKWWFIYKW
jgi:hypothetical protein